MVSLKPSTIECQLEFLKKTNYLTLDLNHMQTTEQHKNKNAKGD